MKFKDKIYLIGYNYCKNKQRTSHRYHLATNGCKSYLCNCAPNMKIGKRVKLCVIWKKSFDRVKFSKIKYTTFKNR